MIQAQSASEQKAKSINKKKERIETFRQQNYWSKLLLINYKKFWFL